MAAQQASGNPNRHRRAIIAMVVVVVVCGIAIVWQGGRIRALGRQVQALQTAATPRTVDDVDTGPSSDRIGAFAEQEGLGREEAEQLLDLCVRYRCGEQDLQDSSQPAIDFRRELSTLLAEDAARAFYNEMGQTRLVAGAQQSLPDASIFDFETACAHWQESSNRPTPDHLILLNRLRRQCGYLDDDRTRWQRPEKVVEALKIRPGDTVADIGAASGFFTDYFAEATGPAGKVYAVDIDDLALGFLAGRITEGANPLGNVEIVLSEPTDVTLPAASVDAALISGVHFHLEPDDVSQRCIGSIYKSMKPRSRLAVIEGADSVPLDVVLAEYLPHGFLLESKYDFLVENESLRPDGHPAEHFVVLMRP